MMVPTPKRSRIVRSYAGEGTGVSIIETEDGTVWRYDACNRSPFRIERTTTNDRFGVFSGDSIEDI